MKVYRRVSRHKRNDMTGKMPIKVRWIDTNTQKVTATPPMEMLRGLISIGPQAVQGQDDEER